MLYYTRNGVTYRVYPMSVSQVHIGTHKVYDRSERSKSWFILGLDSTIGVVDAGVRETSAVQSEY